MELTLNEKNEITLKKVFSGIGFETSDGEFLGVCMRDTGFEFNYLTKNSKTERNWYEAKNGVVKKLGEKTITKEMYDEVCEKLSWAAYMTANLLEGTDLKIHNDKDRLIQQAKDYEHFAVENISYSKKAEAKDIESLNTNAKLEH
jgi:hypothetical protein